MFAVEIRIAVSVLYSAESGICTDDINIDKKPFSASIKPFMSSLIFCGAPTPWSMIIFYACSII